MRWTASAAAPRNEWAPTDHGLITWSFDPVSALNASAPTGGQMYLIRLHVPTATTITNVVLCVGTAGATLTAGQNFATLYDSSRNLLSTTADQATAWTSVGVKTMALAIPQAVDVGDYYAGFWAVGSTLPQFLRGATFPSINTNLTNAAARFSASTGSLTTTAPNPAATGTASSTAWWIGLS